MKNLCQNLLMKFFVVVISAILIVSPVSLTGCTSSQISSVVTIIENNLPTLLSDVASIITIISSLTASSTDATTVALTLATIQSKATDLKTILAEYKAGTTAWSSVVSAVDTLVTASDATLDLSCIKNETSLTQAKLWLVAVDTIVHVIDGAIQTTESTSTIKTKALARKSTLAQHASNWSDSQKSYVVAQLAPVTHNMNWNQLVAAETALGY